MSLFGCSTDEQFLDELNDETSQRDYDQHYCEYHDSYYCDSFDYCNPKDQCFPALNQCRLYRSDINAQ